ncbi:DUF2156 domain-containing protein [Thermodesulfobacteriota bacterium]
MKFEPVTPSDHPRLKKFFAGEKYNHSAYSLPANLVWSNDAYQPYAATDGDALIFSAEYTTRQEFRHLMLPISPTRKYTPEDLRELALRLEFESYWLVPEDYLETYGRSRVDACFQIDAQAEFDDYVYLTEDLATLAGNRYSKKRNLIKQFQRHYVEPGRVQVENIRSSVISDCIEFLELWCEERDCDAYPEEDLACEKQAALNTLENFDILEVQGLFLRLDDSVSAFGIASHLNKTMGVLHFEKAFTDIKGLYQYFDNLCAKRLFQGYQYINKESDMAIPGLAKAKKSYHPVMMVRSFKLTVR